MLFSDSADCQHIVYIIVHDLTLSDAGICDGLQCSAIGNKWEKHVQWFKCTWNVGGFKDSANHTVQTKNNTTHSDVFTMWLIVENNRTPLFDCQIQQHINSALMETDVLSGGTRENPAPVWNSIQHGYKQRWKGKESCPSSISLIYRGTKTKKQTNKKLISIIWYPYFFSKSLFAYDHMTATWSLTHSDRRSLLFCSETE